MKVNTTKPEEAKKRNKNLKWADKDLINIKCYNYQNIGHYASIYTEFLKF